MMVKILNKLTLKFRGVRGSHPVPGEKTLKYGGNTSCIEIRANGNLLIFDAGTGIISLGDEMFEQHINSSNHTHLRQPMRFTIFFSHTHHDHTQGFSFFKPVYQASSICYLFGPKIFQEALEHGLGKAMVSPYFPVELAELPSVKIIRSLKEAECVIYPSKEANPQIVSLLKDMHAIEQAPLKVFVLKSLAHPNGGVYIYKIIYNNKSIVYSTDTEGFWGGDQKLIKFAYKADLLIHDSQYFHEDYISDVFPVQGFGHSTVQMATDIAKQAKVKKLALFHFDPSYDDKTIEKMEKIAKKDFPATFAAYENLIIEI